MSVFIILWLITGLILASLSYAMTFAFFQRSFSIIAHKTYYTDMAYALFVGVSTILIPPLVVFIILLTDGATHGLKFK